MAQWCRKLAECRQLLEFSEEIWNAGLFFDLLLEGSQNRPGQEAAHEETIEAAGDGDGADDASGEGMVSQGHGQNQSNQGDQRGYGATHQGQALLGLLAEYGIL